MPERSTLSVSPLRNDLSTVTLKKSINRGLNTFFCPYVFKIALQHSNSLVPVLSASFFRHLVSFLLFCTHGNEEKMDLLTIPGSIVVPVPTPTHTWLEHPVVKDSFSDKALNEAVEANFAFEYQSSDSSGSGTSLDRKVYRALFLDNDDGEVQ